MSKSVKSKGRLHLPFYRLSLYFVNDWLFVMLLFGVIPVPLVFSKRFLGGRVTGTSMFFAIFIHPDLKDDLSVIVHESVHTRQIYRSAFFHFFLYNFCDNYRYNAEIEAYAYQILFLSTKDGQLKFNKFDGELILNRAAMHISKYPPFNAKGYTAVRAHLKKELIRLHKEYEKFVL